MDFVNKVDLNKYVMSLDSLDFGLLPYTKFNNSRFSLWNANLLNPNGYYEFQVKPKTNEEFNEEFVTDDGDKSSISNDITNTIHENQSTSSTKSKTEDTCTTCHICDIDVPVAYVAEHENSLKHKTYTQLAEVVLNRTRKHMLKKYNGYFPKNSNTYFCESCASEVEIKCRTNHEKSKTHKQSLSLDRLLYDLVALLTDNIEETWTQSKASIDDNVKETKVGNEAQDSTVIISDIIARLYEFETKMTENNIKPDEISQKGTVDAIDNNKVDECNNSVVNGFSQSSDHVSTNISRGNRLLQSIAAAKTKPTNATKSDTFQKLNSEQLFCTTCNLNIHVNILESHKKGTRHTDNSKSNVHYHMTRGVGCEDLICRVCGVQIADDVNKVVSHVATKDHAQKYNDMLKNNHVSQQHDMFYCDPCDTVFLKMNELIHIQKSTHKAKLASFKENTVKVDSDNIRSVIKPAGDSKPLVQNKSYFCDICEVNIPNNPNNIKGHNNGGRHKKNAAKMASKHTNTVKTSIVSANAEVLEVHFQMVATDNEKTLMCRVCNVEVPNMDSSIDEHVTGKKHDSAFNTLMNENHIIFTNDIYLCVYCNILLKPQEVFQHIYVLKHQEEMNFFEEKAKLEKIVLKDSQANSDDNVEETELEAEYQKYKHHFLETDDKKLLKCRICFDIEIPNAAENVASHVKNQTHQDRYKKLMSENILLQTEDHTSYLCCVCQCLVPLRGEIQHAMGWRHIGTKEILLKQTYCVPCEINTIKGEMAFHILTPNHIKNILKYQTLLHYCEYCNELRSKDKALQHEEICHKYLVKNKICFCTKCDPYLPGSSQKK